MEDKKLEDSLNNLANDSQKAQSTEQQKIEMSPEEEIGFHKGSLNTLVAERNELIKMIANVEAIMQSHIKRLEELGVKLQKG